MKCKNCVYNISNQDNDEKYSWCVVKNDNTDIEIERECENYLCMTNADRIRKMTDEELVEAIFEKPEVTYSINFCKNMKSCEDILEDGNSIPDEMCKKCLLEWLQKEVEE